jgi:uncharacterized protein (TIGR02246 family)
MTGDSQPPPVPRLCDDRFALRELVERYAQAVDRGDAAGVAELFTDDGVLATWMEPGRDEPTGERRGRAAIAAAVDGINRYVATHHTVSSTSAVVSGDTAIGETACVAHHVADDDGEVTDRVLYLNYRDEFRRADGGWQFRRREVRVRWAAVTPVSASPGATRVRARAEDPRRSGR